MPYVVIEAGAAGVPMLAANIGGIPEIFGPLKGGLFTAGNVDAMADAIQIALADMPTTLVRARSLHERVHAHFSQNAMVEGVLSGYDEAFSRH
jgi:glycosyltransferase involved in cell wall biosynthesis